MRATCRSWLPVLAVLGFCAPPLLAGEVPSKAQLDAEAAEVGAYRLSLATLHKVAKAFRTHDATISTNPDAFRARIEKLEVDAGPDGSPLTMRAAVARVESVPEFKRSLAAAGLSSREYVVFSLTLLVAALADASMTQTGKLPPDATPTLAENVKWYQANRAELQRYTQEMEKLGAKYEEPEASGDDEHVDEAEEGDEDDGTDPPQS